MDRFHPYSPPNYRVSKITYSLNFAAISYIFTDVHSIKSTGCFKKHHFRYVRNMGNIATILSIFGTRTHYFQTRLEFH